MKKILILLFVVALVLTPNLADAEQLSFIDILQQQVDNIRTQIMGLLQQSGGQMSAVVGSGDGALNIRAYNDCIFDSSDSDCKRYVPDVYITLTQGGDKDPVVIFDGKTDSNGYLRLDGLERGFYKLVSGIKGGAYKDRSGIYDRSVFIVGGSAQTFNLFFKESDDDGGEAPETLQVKSPTRGQEIEIGDDILVRWEPSSPGLVLVDMLDSNGNYKATMFSEKGHGDTVPNISGALKVSTSNYYSPGQYKIKVYEYDEDTYSAGNAREGRHAISGVFNLVSGDGDDQYQAPAVIDSIEAKASEEGEIYSGAKAYIRGEGLEGELKIQLGNIEPKFVYVQGQSDGYAEFVVPEYPEPVYVTITITNSSGLESRPYSVYINTVTSDDQRAPSVLGDVNFDDDVDLADAILVLRHVRGLTILSGDQFVAGDVDGNGVIDLEDVRMILRIAVDL